jgi:hypothetical protein
MLSFFKIQAIGGTADHFYVVRSVYHKQNRVNLSYG